jgi:hypothetical protein
MARLALPPAFVGVAFAIALALIAGWLAVGLSQEFYSIAPYHYDSAAYRLQAVELHDIRESSGLIAALTQSLQTKDSLDLTLRLLFAPRFLLHRFGHLAILLPFMSVWIFLIIWYVFSRTHSLLLGGATVAFLFTFPFIFKPLQGMGDYWKDNLATWLLGSAVVTWILAELLTRRRWSLLCGLLLGMLVMQRSVAAIYAAILFLPLFVWATYWRVRLDGWMPALARLAVFVVPAALLGGLVMLVQWQQLYTYYFVAGYAYGTPARVAQYLIDNFHRWFGFAPFLLLAVTAVCLLSTSSWRRERRAMITTGWLVVGLPLAVIATASFYFGLLALWPVLLVTFFAALLPTLQGVQHRQMIAAMLGIIALAASIVQYQVSASDARELADQRAPLRQLHQQLARLILAQPEPRAYGLLIDEMEDPFLNYVVFDQGVWLGPQAAYITIHDSYARAKFGKMTPQQIADANIRNLEKHDRTVAVAYCRPEEVMTQPRFLSDGKLIAAPAAMAVNQHLRNSPHWRALQQINSPYGCLYVYQFSVRPLTEVERWEQVKSYVGLDEISVALPLAPDVRMYDYKSYYSPERANGVYYQWLPSGKGKLRLTLFSNRARTIALQGWASAGPARRDELRTLVVANGAAEATQSVERAAEIHVKVQLHPGVNELDVYVREAADTAPVGNDKRELMLLLVSPRLVPDSD